MGDEKLIITSVAVSRCNMEILPQKPEVVTVSKSRLGGKFKN